MNKEIMLEEDGLFDDFVDEDFAEETNDETEESTDEGTPTSNDTPIDNDSNKAEEPFMTIKYNSEEKGLSKEEAITMAQKGMNYDKINSNYTAMKGDYDAIKPIHDTLSRLAEENGMDVAAYVQSLQDMQTSHAVSQEMKKLKEQYPTTDDALLEEIAKKRVADNVNANVTKMQQEKQNTQNEELARKNEIKRQLDVFEKRYPNVNPETLDQKVYDLMNDGLTLLEAYQEVEAEKRAVEAQKQQEKEKVEKQNKSNAKKGLGNIGNAEKVEVDDFLAGLFDD